MGTEIERKFLVTGTDWRTQAPVVYRQGYLNRDRQRTVRVRVAAGTGFLTVKGISIGASRAEFEYEIPQADAEEMLGLCEQPLVEKKRHLIDFAGLRWEVDEFTGENQGLVVAEVELDSADQSITLPPWVTAEVTDDNRYFNSSLSRRPFTTWESSEFRE